MARPGMEEEESGGRKARERRAGTAPTATTGTPLSPGPRSAPNPLSEGELGRRFVGDMDYTQGAGRELTDRYRAGIAEDPREAFATSTGAAIDRFKGEFGGNLRELRHSQVGSGRVDTGFGYRDEDVLFRAMSKDLTNTLADRALDAESINQQRLRDMGGLGYEHSRDALDASSGTYQTMRQQRLADKANKRSFWGNLLSGVLTAGGAIAGSFVGQPVAGAAAGRAVGGAITK